MATLARRENWGEAVTMQRDGFTPGWAYLRSRPVRTAFLIDLDVWAPGGSELAAIFDSIADYAVNFWGARRDTIHCFRGQAGLTDDQWFDLEAADVDRIHAFSDLPVSLIERLHSLRPWKMTKGEGPESWRRLNYSLPGISAPPTIENVAAYRAPLLAVGFTESCPQKIKSCLQRNFGTYSQWIDSRTPLKIQRDAYMTQLLEAAGHRQDIISDLSSVGTLFNTLAGDIGLTGTFRPAPRVVMPNQISSLVLPQTLWPRRPDLELFVGDSPELFEAYWAASHRSGVWPEPAYYCLWLPKEFFLHDDLRSGVHAYLWQHGHWHSSNRRAINVIADADSADAVQGVVGTMRTGHRSIHADVYRLEAWSKRLRDQRRSERREMGLPVRMTSQVASRFRLTEEKNLLPVPMPPALSNFAAGGTWAVEMQVEHDQQYVINQGNLYLLPKQRGADILPYMMRRIGRVGSRGLMVGRMESRRGEKPEIAVTVIAPDRLVPMLLSVSSTEHLDSDDLRRGKIPNDRSDLSFKLSAPGRHLREVVGLFGGLLEARPFVQRLVWWKIFRFLTGHRLDKDERAEEAIKRCFTKKLRNYKEPGKIAEDLARAAARLFEARLSDRYITFEEFNQRLAAYTASLGAPKDVHFGGTSMGIHERAEPISSDDFKESIAFLLEKDILHLGAADRCPKCGADRWNPVADLVQQIECPGCGTVHALGPEPEWSYKLNTLVQSSMNTGAMSVLHAYIGIWSAFASFFYYPSLEFYEPGQDEPAGEIDLLCLHDGKLIFGEVKAGRRPISRDLQRFVENLLRFRPQRGILFVLPEHEADARALFAPHQAVAIAAGIPTDVFVLPLF